MYFACYTNSMGTPCIGSNVRTQASRITNLVSMLALEVHEDHHLLTVEALDKKLGANV